MSYSIYPRLVEPHVFQYAEELFVGFDPTDGGSGIVGAWRTQVEAHDALLACVEPVVAPIDMLLYCPNCGVQHIDKDNWQELSIRAAEIGVDREGDRAYSDWLEEHEWTNPPHRSHLCASCGCIWRPADVPTNGVAAITTQGKADTWVGKAAFAAPALATPTSEPDLHDFKTHREPWRKAIEHLARQDDSGYWKHELQAFDKAMVDFDRATAPPPPVPLTAATLADALDDFWNAALGAQRNEHHTVSCIAEGLHAVAQKLREVEP